VVMGYLEVVIERLEVVIGCLGVVMRWLWGI